MARILGHSTAFRTVGRVFDADEARNVVIDEEPQGVSLSWGARNGAAKSAQYGWLELDRLRQAAVEQVNAGGSTLGRAEQRQNARAWSELLRTLGQNLDAEEAETSSVTGDLNGLSASWISGGRFLTRQYSAAELWEASRRRAALRQSTG